MEEPTSIKLQDEDRLAQLGYKQELRRDWSMLHNFGVSFSIIVSKKYCFCCKPRYRHSSQIKSL